MRRFLPFACVFVLMTISVRHVSAQTVLELTDSARKDLQTRLDAKKEESKKAEESWKKNSTAATTSQLQTSHQDEFAFESALTLLQSVRESLVSGGDDMALMQLKNLPSSSASLPQESQAAIAAIAQRIQTERADKGAAYSKEVDDACQRAGGVVLAAREPKDLDVSLKDLQRVFDLPTPGRSGDSGNIATRLRNAIQFVNRWQDYLVARSHNDDNNVRTILQNLLQGNDRPLIPRSEILSRIPQTESERESAARARRADTGRSRAQIEADAFGIVRGVKHLDEVSAALAKLVELRAESESVTNTGNRSDSVLGAALVGMASLQKSILDYRNGLSPGIGSVLIRMEYGSNAEVNLALWPLRLQLVREAAPQLMGVAADEKSADEPIGAYLHRLIETAKTHQNWSAVIGGLQILRVLSAPDNNPYGISDGPEITAFQNLLSADNLEKAGQYEEAVVLYLTALRTGQPGLPVAWIGEHLAAVQKSHPQEYARGKGQPTDDSRAASLEMLRAYRSLESQRNSTAAADRHDAGATVVAPPTTLTVTPVSDATPGASPASSATPTPAAVPQR